MIVPRKVAFLILLAGILQRIRCSFGRHPAEATRVLESESSLTGTFTRTYHQCKLCRRRYNFTASIGK